MYAMRPATSGATSVPGRNTTIIARAARALRAAQAGPAAARSLAPDCVPSIRKSANGSHHTMSLKRTRVKVRTGHSPERTVSTQPIGPRILPRSPMAMKGTARSSRTAA